MKYFYKYFTARVVLLTLAMLLSSPLIAWAQGTITIKGVVTDVEKEPLTGVSIRIKGTTMGTTTTASGSYTLQGVPRTATLIFSYVGMKKQEIPVSGRTTIDVVLEDDAQVTQEVVVVGYGTQEGEPHWRRLLHRLQVPSCSPSTEYRTGSAGDDPWA